MIKNLIARLRGETLPEGIVKSNRRIEATEVEVSSKYPGLLAEVTVFCISWYAQMALPRQMPWLIQTA